MNREDIKPNTTWEGKPALLRYSISEEMYYHRYVDSDWESRCIVSEVGIGIDAFEPDGYVGGTYGEFRFCWYQFTSGPRAARLMVFDDAWKVLAHLNSLGFMDRLLEFEQSGADSGNPEITTADLVAILDELGFTDTTERTDPNAPRLSDMRLTVTDVKAGDEFWQEGRHFYTFLEDVHPAEEAGLVVARVKHEPDKGEEPRLFGVDMHIDIRRPVVLP